ncbi:MAG TPA: ATP-binding protein, partial [Pseudomonadales bacterium]|nr:ATP-binding protein [Pseudomonadales bacterium]
IWQPDQAKGLTVMVDRIRLQQVLVQLLENAIKFTDEGGIHISVVPIAKQVVITIKDTGIGMHEAQLNEVMQGVGQVDPSLTKRVSGGGLGLSISRWLIQQMGGELTVMSSPNKGTQVSMTLERYAD